MKQNLKDCFTLFVTCHHVNSNTLVAVSKQLAVYFFFSHCLIRLLSSDFQRLIGLPAQPDRVTEPFDRYVIVLDAILVNQNLNSNARGLSTA
jgi:hypothetical protein